jgi:hypothetical protein
VNTRRGIHKYIKYESFSCRLVDGEGGSTKSQNVKKKNPAIEYIVTPLTCELVEGMNAVFLRSITRCVWEHNPRATPSRHHVLL